VPVTLDVVRAAQPGSDHPSYVGQYIGDQPSRDMAYHQGTVWGWLLGRS